MLINRLRKVQSFLNNSNHAGAFQHNRNHISSFIQFEPSSTKEDSRPENILNMYGDFWQTDGSPNPHLNITFTNSLLRLSSLSIFSCEKNNCFKDLDVMGTNTGENWETVCKIKETYDTFRGKPRNHPCKSEFYYRKFKFSLAGKDVNNSNRLTFQYLEMFGDIIQINDSYYTKINTVNTFRANCFLFTLLNGNI